jgi:hypothetical protein
MPPRRRLLGSNIREFVTAGAAHFEIHNPETGRQFYYRVKQSTKRPQRLLVLALVERDGKRVYAQFGQIEDGVFDLASTLKIPASSLAIKAFEWFWRNVGEPWPVEIYYDGRCGKCGGTGVRPLMRPFGFHYQCAGLRQFMTPKEKRAAARESSRRRQQVVDEYQERNKYRDESQF